MNNDALHERARALAPELVGLTEDAASTRVAGHDGLSIRFAAEGQPVTMEFRYGRITAETRDGVVVDAGPG